MADEDKQSEHVDNTSMDCIPALDDAIKDLPEDAQKNVKKILYSRASLSMHGFMPVSNPLYEKLDTGLIGKMIENSENESKREYGQEKFNKICGLIILIAILITVATLIYIFQSHIEDIRDLLMPIIYIAAGVAGGYGIGKSQNNEKL